MKKLGIKAKLLFTTALAAAICFALPGIFSFVSYGMSYDIITDNNCIRICKLNGDTLTVEGIYKQAGETTYTAENRIKAYCVNGDKVYIFSDSSEQRDLSVVTVYKNGARRKDIRIINLKTPSHTAMAADKSGNIYIIDSDNRIRIYNQDGRETRKSAEKFYGLILNSNYIYSYNSHGIYRISASREERVNTHSPSSPLRAVSDRFIGDTSGRIYDIDSGAALDLNCGSACEGGGYLICSFGSTLKALDKVTAEAKMYYDIGFTPASLANIDNKVIAVNADGAARITRISLSEFTKYENEKKDKEKRNDKPKAPKATVPEEVRLDFKNVRVEGKRIYLDPQTTKTRFRESIIFSGYEIEFNEPTRRYLGTGRKIRFKRADNTDEYTVIVPGDITGEGNVNTIDIGDMFQYLLKEKQPKGIFAVSADINEDKAINNQDLVLMARKYENSKG